MISDTDNRGRRRRVKQDLPGKLLSVRTNIRDDGNNPNLQDKVVLCLSVSFGKNTDWADVTVLDPDGTVGLLVADLLELEQVLTGNLSGANFRNWGVSVSLL